MKKRILALGLLPLLVQARTLETITIVGSKTLEYNPNISQDFSLIQAIMPESVNTAGGYGGFSGFTERGTQTIHTQVFRNGIPANDAGSGWYDFGHDISTGNERVKFITGPNSVLYGSGSLSGTVFINDKIGNNAVVRLGNKHNMTVLNIDNKLSISHFDVNNGSVRNDNTESDRYQNTSLATMFNINNLKVNANYTNYSYDYDQCWTVDLYLPTDDCKQKGERGGVGIHNDNITLGYNFNNAKYYSKNLISFDSKSERIYGDLHNTIIQKFNKTTYGLTLSEEKYNNQSRTSYSSYLSINSLNDRLGAGLRLNGDVLVGRFGINYKNFKLQAGTSYRKPTLYEINGDSYVNSNTNLQSEKAKGIEFAYKYLTLFYYKFSEGIDYDFNNNQFVNTGNYKTKGIRVEKTFDLFNGTLSINSGYTHSDQLRVPKYKSIIMTEHVIYNFNFKLKYTMMHNRGLDFTGEKIDDVKQFDTVVEKKLSNKLVLSFSIKNLFNNQYEHIPGYSANGRKFFLTTNYKL